MKSRYSAVTVFKGAKTLALIVLVCGFATIRDAPASAADLPGDTVTVWHSNDEFVALVPRDALAGPTPPLNAHPVTLKAEELAKTLSRISVTHDGKQHPLLDTKTATRIAPPLAQAFARASAQQDVAFAAITRVAGDLIGENDVSVAVRAFYLDQRLQLIIGDLHASTVAPEFYRSPLGGRKIDRRVHPHHIGQRATETPHPGSRFDPAPGIDLAAPNGARRSDWLVVDLTATTSAGNTGPARENATAPGKPSAAGASRSSEAARTIEERLLLLQRLRERGLITDEEYARKREKILDEL